MAIFATRRMLPCVLAVLAAAPAFAASTVIGGGNASGAWLGLFIGLILGFFSPSPWGSLITGLVAVRTKGFVFLMVTLAIAELAHKQAEAMPLTGGSNGLSTPAITLLPGGEPIRLGQCA